MKLPVAPIKRKIANINNIMHLHKQSWSPLSVIWVFSHMYQ